jgi:hypothetical protein
LIDYLGGDAVSDWSKARDQAAGLNYSELYGEGFKAFQLGADWALMVLDAGIHSELIKERDALKAEMKRLKSEVAGLTKLADLGESVLSDTEDKCDALKAEVERLKTMDLTAAVLANDIELIKERDQLKADVDEYRKTIKLQGEEVERLKGDAFGRLLERRTRELAKERDKSRRLAEALKDLYETTLSECGMQDWEIEAGDTSSLGNAKQALAEYEGEK